MEQQTNTLIELSQIKKEFKKNKTALTVLDDLNLKIDQGDFTSVMGPSGSGKTTLLNLIGGLDRPTSGSLQINGEDISKYSDSALTTWRSRNIGFVFQFYNLLPTLTAQANVELPLLLTSLSSAQRKHRAKIALEVVGLGDRAGHRPNELSGGQEQRVAIARAIVNDPVLLVCDEPTGDLDRETADQVLEILKTLNEQQGKTILMVTHDPKAAQYARRHITMDKGNLVDDPTLLNQVEA
ncbi:MAG: ABC transporter ATP-binding protein [Pseudomonadota bacterium]